MTKCKKCKEIISGDCMLTTGTCVFCHYEIDSWDSNGELVTKEESTYKKIDILQSKLMPDYKESLEKAVRHYWDRPTVCDIPVKRGTTIFTFIYSNMIREFDLKDYRRGQWYGKV